MDGVWKTCEEKDDSQQQRALKPPKKPLIVSQI